MNKLKTSPGPWKRDQYGAVMDANGEIVRLHGFALCCGYTEKGDPSFANTHVTVASSELYEALDKCARLLYVHASVDGESGVALRDAVAALKKARGE